jgi:hypothetical protein
VIPTEAFGGVRSVTGVVGRVVVVFGFGLGFGLGFFFLKEISTEEADLALAEAPTAVVAVPSIPVMMATAANRALCRRT